MIHIDDISIKVAKELGLDINLVKQINRLQYKTLAETIREGEFKPVSLIYIGKFKRSKKYNEDGSFKTKADSLRIHQSNIKKSEDREASRREMENLSKVSNQD